VLTECYELVLVSSSIVLRDSRAHTAVSIEIGATIPPAAEAAAPVAHGIRKQGRPLLGAHMAPSGHDTNLGTAPAPHGFQLGVRDTRPN
jgi:hypothetical protein